MSDILLERLSRPDVAGLADWQAAEVLRRPDPSLPPNHTWTPTSLGVAGFMDALGADAAAIFLDRIDQLASQSSTSGFFLMRKLIEADKFDLSRPSSRELLDRCVELEILSEGQKDQILGASLKISHPSWSEHTGIAVDARVIGLARGGR